MPPAPQGTGKGKAGNHVRATDEPLKSRNEPRQQTMKAKKAECAHTTAALGVGGVGRAGRAAGRAAGPTNT